MSSWFNDNENRKFHANIQINEQPNSIHWQQMSTHNGELLYTSTTKRTDQELHANYLLQDQCSWHYFDGCSSIGKAECSTAGDSVKQKVHERSSLEMKVNQRQKIQSPEKERTYFKCSKKALKHIPLAHVGLLGTSSQNFQNGQIIKRARRRYRTPSPKVLRLRREAANARERRRMSHLNDAFEELRKTLPKVEDGRRLSKFETLQWAQLYIDSLNELLLR